MRVTVIAPRKDLTDPHRNGLQELQRRRLGDIPYVTGYYEHDNPDVWSFSRAIDVGREQVTTTPGLVVSPADYLLEPDVIEAAGALLDTYAWAQVYARTVVLPEAVTTEMLAGRVPSLMGVQCRLLSACMACTAVRADVFDDVGGMDPRFQGWGPEDASFRMKLEVLHGPPAPPPGDQVFELWSPGMGEWRNGRYDGYAPNRKHNVDLWLHYVAAVTPEQMRALADKAKAALERG